VGEGARTVCLIRIPRRTHDLIRESLMRARSWPRNDGTRLGMGGSGPWRHLYRNSVSCSLLDRPHIDLVGELRCLSPPG
jgi:hypothetical protein